VEQETKLGLSFRWFFESFRWV